MPRVVYVVNVSSFLEPSHCTERLLFANPQLRNHLTIALHVVTSQVVEQAPAFAYNFQQSAAGPMIFTMGFEVLGQVRDPFAQ